MLAMLESKGFDPENIRPLIDDDDSFPVPNHVNVKKALTWLCSDREEGDIIFMHFSGHGTQVSESRLTSVKFHPLLVSNTHSINTLTRGRFIDVGSRR